jgi:hypothetical protein
VTRESAQWGEFDGAPWPTDHFGEIGYSLNAPGFESHFDHESAFRKIVNRFSE